MKRTELLLSGVSASFFLLYLLGGVGMSLFMMLSLSLLGALYAYLGFAHLNGVRMAQVFKKEAYSSIRFTDILIGIFGGIGMAAIINSVLFAIMLWPGRGSLFVSGSIFLGIAIVMAFVLLGTYPLLKERLVKRVAIYMVLGGLFYVIPAGFWFSIRYRNNPEYVEAMIEHYNNPSKENAEKLDQVTEEMLRNSEK